jgi:hypothetical protein
MRRRLPLLPCYLLVVLTPAPAGQERTRREPITSEQSEVFALLDKFDSLDTSKHPFIQITWSRRDHGGLWKRRHRYGFLLGARGRQFRARFVELGKATLDFPQPDEDASCRVTFKPFSLAAFARGFVAERSAKLEYIEKHPERPVENWFHLSQSNPAPPEIVLLLVARACARRGLTADMNAVWNALP